MLRSMFTAVSSLNLHQTWLDVISDNLANANTTAYKASRVVFQDQFAQLVSPGTAPTAQLGGINPTQIGLGVQLGYVSPVFNQGMLQATGRYNDLAIQGEGFFIYNNGTEQLYSREGALEVDANGYLVNSSTGMRIQGWQGQLGANTVNTNGPITSINVPMNSTMARETSTALIGGNLDTDVAVGQSVNISYAVYDSLGNTHNVAVQFTRATANTWNWQVTGPAANAAAGAGVLAFSNTGQYNAAGSSVTTPITLNGSTGADSLALTMDLSNLTMLQADTTATLTNQDGLPTGSISDVFAAPNTGEVYAVYSNGLKQLVGQLAIARFTNPAGMLREGHNLFRVGLNAGDPQVGTAATGGRGVIASGYLEASNVDMAQEFTNMILAQRGFQASSRVISTSDEILQELVNLKR